MGTVSGLQTCHAFENKKINHFGPIGSEYEDRKFFKNPDFKKMQRFKQSEKCK
jgi:hypothetical protein